MSRHHAKRLLPTPERIARIRGFGPLARFLEARPWLWAAHRRSVARGVGLGVFAGVVPLPMQMALAALLAVGLRANVAAAVAATWFTNPITFVPILTMAWWLGSLVMGDGGELQLPAMAAFDWAHPASWPATLWGWLSALGPTVVVGLVPTAIILGCVAWTVTMLAWRVAVTIAWRNRRQLRRLRG